MDDLTISTWLWGNKYDQNDVLKLYNGFRRHLKQTHRFILFTSVTRLSLPGNIDIYPIPDMELTKIKGCFARLRMFDTQFQLQHNITGRLVCTDLDTVITGNLDPLFNRPEPFLILQGANSENPCPYCGALMMVRTGAYPELWNDFDIAKIDEIPKYKFPDDQGWIWQKIPDAAGWKAGVDGVYAFMKPGWPGGHYLPKDARLVTFNGWRSPKLFRSLDWIRRNWVG